MNEVIGLAVGFAFVCIVIIASVLYFRKKECPTPSEKDGIYDSKCKLTGCVIGKQLYKDKCYSIGDACEIEKPVVNGGYTIDKGGNCILNSCGTDEFVVDDKCITQGGPCTPPGTPDPNGEYMTTDDGCSLYNCKNGYELKDGACVCTGNKQVVDGNCVCQKENPSGGCHDTGESCEPDGTRVDNGNYKIDTFYRCTIDSCTGDTDKYTFAPDETREKCEMTCKGNWSDPQKNCETCTKFQTKDGKQCLKAGDECGTYKAYRIPQKKYVFANADPNGPLQCCKHGLSKSKKAKCDPPN